MMETVFNKAVRVPRVRKDRPGRGSGRAAWPLPRRSDKAALASLLDYQSPTAALLEEPVPLMSRAAVWLVAGLVMTSVVAMAIFPIDRVVTVTGRVAAQDGNLRIQPLDVAILRFVNVHDGDIVKAGDLLAKLDPTLADADSASHKAQAESLSAELARLRAELAGETYEPSPALASQIQFAIYVQQRAELAAHETRFEARRLSAEADVRQAVSDGAGYRERLDIALQIEEKRRLLEELKVGSQMDLLRAKDSRIEMARGRESAEAKLDSARRTLAALIAERDGFFRQRKAETARSLADAERKLSETRELLNKAMLRSRLVELRAPEDAVVLKVSTRSPGSVIQSGEELITLVPLAAKLEIDVSIPGRDAGFVQPGASVVIKFDSFDSRTYGTATGTMRLVSADSFRPQEGPRRGSGSDGTGTVNYEGRITLDAVNLHGTPANFRVVPGMPVVADIKAGERTILGYLLAGSVPLFTNGMREP